MNHDEGSEMAGTVFRPLKPFIRRRRDERQLTISILLYITIFVEAYQHKD